MCYVWAQNTPICPEQNFLILTIIITFIYLLVLFIGQNSKKNSYSGCKIMRMCHFLNPKWFICTKRKSFWKIINITLTHLLDPFIVQNFKKILPVDPDPLWPISQMRILFRKLVNEPCFFHSWLSTFQKSKSNIYLLVKYWRLKNTEISLTEKNFWL